MENADRWKENVIFFFSGICDLFQRTVFKENRVNTEMRVLFSLEKKEQTLTHQPWNRIWPYHLWEAYTCHFLTFLVLQMEGVIFFVFCQVDCKWCLWKQLELYYCTTKQTPRRYNHGQAIVWKSIIWLNIIN